jgi:hypothetical protein
MRPITWASAGFNSLFCIFRYNGVAVDSYTAADFNGFSEFGVFASEKMLKYVFIL